MEPRFFRFAKGFLGSSIPRVPLEMRFFFYRLLRVRILSLTLSYLVAAAELQRQQYIMFFIALAGSIQLARTIVIRAPRVSRESFPTETHTQGITRNVCGWCVCVSGPLVRRRTHAFLFTCFRLYSFFPFVLSPPGSLPLSCLCNFFAVYTIILYWRAHCSSCAHRKDRRRLGRAKRACRTRRTYIYTP